MDMDIFDLAKAKKMFGGGGGKREGTAVPVGEEIERIYFNINSPQEETKAILSQLTFILTDLFPSPIYPILATTGSQFAPPIYLFAVKTGGNYRIMGCTDISVKETLFTLYSSTEGFGKGWITLFNNVPIVVSTLFTVSSGMTELMGTPIGTENEKIKNIVSITPF